MFRNIRLKRLAVKFLIVLAPILPSAAARAGAGDTVTPMSGSAEARPAGNDSAPAEHRFNLFYTIRNNVILHFIGIFGRPLNFGAPNPAIDTPKRLQFDVNYVF